MILFLETIFLSNLEIRNLESSVTKDLKAHTVENQRPDRH